MTRIRALRQGRGLRLIDMAFETRIHPTQLSYVERGKVAASARVKKTLCSFLGVEPDELFGVDGLAVLDKKAARQEAAEREVRCIH